MKRKHLLTAEEAAAQADKYNEENEVNLMKVLDEIDEASNEGRKSTGVDVNLLDKRTKQRLIDLGYRFGKTWSSDSDGIYPGGTYQKVMWGKRDNE